MINRFKRIFIVTLATIAASCSYSPSYVSVLGANELEHESVAYVINHGSPNRYHLWLYAVDGVKITELDSTGSVYYAIQPGFHTLWVLEPMTGIGMWDIVPNSPNRCFTFEVNLIAGKTYQLFPTEDGQEAKLVDSISNLEYAVGVLVDESYWTCYWDK
jgi:hypothetical protein